ncbi:hypothetical protein [Pseudomonas sp. BBP2017]|uniref:hypothetical protein n=1 Tax=Pseudomonas sp. BBP2017 TaxID=2109731 RepID=UPI000D13026B|nr:hypothetical protein [Pseudomonas sp. BBP2017]PSS59187.1 hypothetical protein C6382_02165 [Pseudomonas sp. BBP2017]
MPRRKSVQISDEDQVEQLIERARKLLPQRKLSYEADWLISGKIGSEQWIVVDDYDKQTTFEIRFDARLPDGSLLTEPKNIRLLAPIQKVAFHLRMGNLEHFYVGHRHWMRIIATPINLARWLVLNAEVFQPQRYGFRLLTDDHMRAYLKEYSHGGLANTLKLGERFLTLLHEQTKTSLSIHEIFEKRLCLDEGFIIESARWLNTQDAYVNCKDSKEQKVSRKYLERILGCSAFLFEKYPSIANIINQFNLRRACSPTDMIELTPLEDRRITKESNIVRKTMRAQIKEIKIFVSAHNHLSDEIPFLSTSVFREKYDDNLAMDGHTHLIPLEVGLDAINNAAEMIVVYGKQIVEAASFFAGEYTHLRSSTTQSRCTTIINRLAHRKRNDWHSEPKYGNVPLFERYNVTTFSSQSRTLSIEAGITFKTLQQAFYGACALLIGMCKPIRDGELHKLELNCLDLEFEGGGAVLSFALEKSGVLGENQNIQRPIPSVVARAIQLLQVLSAKLRHIYDDQSGPVAALLFYIPSFTVLRPTGKALSESLNHCIDKFCLVFDPPRDPLGNPWTIRVHQMRKFFLLVMYKHHNSDLRRTLGYAAGHIDENQIDEYTAFSHDDPECVKYESECISDLLVSLEQGQVTPDGHDGLQALYSHVCNHFNVTKVQSLSHANFIRFLNMLQRNGKYKSTVYTVEIKGSDGTLTTIEFAIKFEGLQDDQFDRG